MPEGPFSQIGAHIYKVFYNAIGAQQTQPAHTRIVVQTPSTSLALYGDCTAFFECHCIFNMPSVQCERHENAVHALRALEKLSESITRAQRIANKNSV